MSKAASLGSVGVTDRVDGNTGMSEPFPFCGTQQKALRKAVGQVTKLSPDVVGMVLDAYHHVLAEQLIEYGQVSIPHVGSIRASVGAVQPDGTPIVHLDAVVDDQVARVWRWRIGQGNEGRISRYTWQQALPFAQGVQPPVNVQWPGWDQVYVGAKYRADVARYEAIAKLATIL